MQHPVSHIKSKRRDLAAFQTLAPAPYDACEKALSSTGIARLQQYYGPAKNISVNPTAH